MEKIETWIISNHTSSVQEKSFLCASTAALKLPVSQVLKFIWSLYQFFIIHFEIVLIYLTPDTVTSCSHFIFSVLEEKTHFMYRDTFCPIDIAFFS